MLLHKQQIKTLELTAGFNVTAEIENKQGYTLGLRVTFENKQALDDYLPHPIHQEFVSSLSGVIDNVIVVDYEIFEKHDKGKFPS